MLNEMQRSSKPEFVNLLGSPGIDSQPGGPVRQPSLTYRPARLHRLAESIPWHRFLGSLNVSKYGLCLGSVPRKLLFWLHSREQPSPKGLNNIKKSAVSRGVNTSKKTGQMSSKYGEIIKKLISVFGEKPARGLPKPPPTTPHLDLAAFTRGENAKLGCRARNPPAGLRRGGKGRGENTAFL